MDKKEIIEMLTDMDMYMEDMLEQQEEQIDSMVDAYENQIEDQVDAYVSQLEKQVEDQIEDQLKFEQDMVDAYEDQMDDIIDGLVAEQQKAFEKLNGLNDNTSYELQYELKDLAMPIIDIVFTEEDGVKFFNEYLQAETIGKFKYINLVKITYNDEGIESTETLLSYKAEDNE